MFANSGLRNEMLAFMHTVFILGLFKEVPHDSNYKALPKHKKVYFSLKTKYIILRLNYYFTDRIQTFQTTGIT